MFLRLSVLFIACNLAFAATSDRLLEEVKSVEEARARLVFKDRPTITDEQYLRALDGRIVTGLFINKKGKTGQGWGVTVYPEPVQRIWAALTNEEDMDGKMSLEHSAVLEGPEHGHGRVVFQSLDLPRPLSDRWWVTRVSHGVDAYRASAGKLWEVSWVDENKTYSLANTEFAAYGERATPLEWTTGSWLMIPLSNGHTLVEYTVSTDPGGRIPAAFASRFAPSQVETAMEELLELVEKQKQETLPGGLVKPDGSPLF